MKNDYYKCNPEVQERDRKQALWLKGTSCPPNRHNPTNGSVSTFGDLSPIQRTGTNDVSKIDFEAEDALVTTEPPYDPNDNPMETTSVNRFSIRSNVLLSIH